MEIDSQVVDGHVLTSVIASELRICDHRALAEIAISNEEIAERMARFYANDYGMARVHVLKGADERPLSENMRLLAQRKLGFQIPEFVTREHAQEKPWSAPFTHRHPCRDLVVRQLVDVDRSRIPPGKVLTNGGYFLLDPQEDDSIYSAIGDAYGIVVSEGRFLSFGGVARTGMVRERGGLARFCELSLADFDISFDGMCPPDDIYYRDAPDVALVTSERPDLLDLVVVHGETVAVQHGGGTRVPVNGFVASFDREQALRYLGQDLPKVRIRHKEIEIDLCIQCGPRLIRDGEIVVQQDDYITEKFIFEGRMVGILPMYFPEDPVDACEKTKCALGVSRDGLFVWACLKSTDGSFVSPRMLGTSMLDLGVADAMMLDGGGLSEGLWEGSPDLRFPNRATSPAILPGVRLNVPDSRVTLPFMEAIYGQEDGISWKAR